MIKPFVTTVRCLSSKVRRWAVSAPSTQDIGILSFLLLIITFQPFYLYGQINTFELGLYLPGIDAILKGQIPYRDFFHLRGPFELYLPALVMRLFGRSIASLETYFYVGNVLSLIVCIFIGKELLRLRGMLYLMLLVVTARTFPRVVFTFWGGLRFTFGLLAIYCGIRYFKSRRLEWLGIAGFLTALAALTSMEVGVCALAGISLSLMLHFYISKDAKRTCAAIGTYAGGVLLLLIPYFIYLWMNGALGAYVDITTSVLHNMATVFIQTEPVPETPIQFLLAMVTPGGKNFRHITPFYTYIFLGGYFYIRHRKEGESSRLEFGLLALAGYGLLMYISAFRNLWANAFEMALQPQKIVLFFLLEHLYLACRDRLKSPSAGKMILSIAIAGVTLSSLAYSIDRFQKRFPGVQLLFGKKISKIQPLWTEDKIIVKSGALRGMTLPAWQAQDFQELSDYLATRTKPDEPVLMFLEMGTHHFAADRPFVGRFPVISMAWINDRWHAEFMNDLRATHPRFAVVPKKFPDHFYTQYFKVPANKKKFDEVTGYIQNHYALSTSTPSLNIFVRKAEGKEEVR